MKFKTVVFLMIVLSIVTGCSIKEEINEAQRIVSVSVNLKVSHPVNSKVSHLRYNKPYI